MKDLEANKFAAFEVDYKLRRPGDHTFFIEPAPYWEPAEEAFIVHYTKVIVNCFGLEEGWDQPVGMKTEIQPLTRPYGLYTNNVFQGQVLVNGKAVPHSEVEVEYYNEDGSLKPNADPFITQVVKADANGVFTYAMPKAGWWGFAALNEDDKTMKHEGKDYPVEIGAVLWVKTHDMK
jgi:cobalt/nickel transport protein